MKIPAPRLPFCRSALCAALALLVGGLPVPAFGSRGADSVQRFKDDVRFLNGKLLPAKYRVRRQTGGEDAWAELQGQMEQLKQVLETLQDLGGRIDASESRLRYLKVFEVEPKLREVERVQLWAEQQSQVFADRLAGLQREGNQAGAKPHNSETEATCSTCREVAAVAGRFGAVQAEARKFIGEAQREFERAVAAAGRAQQEMGEVGAKHGAAATEFGDVAGQYAAIRDPLAGRLQEIENQPDTNLPLTPFGPGAVPAGTLVRPAPIGAGVTPRALDQLRIVTATSNTAADSRDDHLGVGPVTTSMVSGYQFDTTEGLPPVDLPSVETPEGVAVDEFAQPPESAAVPLVLETSPTQRPDAPTETKASLRLQQAEHEQTQHFGLLEKLYAERKNLAQQGPAASSQDWTRVVNRISETQAQINFSEATKRISEGSAAVDMTLRTKPRRTSDVIVPPPDP